MVIFNSSCTNIFFNIGIQKSNVFCTYHDNGNINIKGFLKKSDKNHQYIIIERADNFGFDKPLGYSEIMYSLNKHQADSTWYFYYDNGKVELEAKFISNKKKGQWKYYDLNSDVFLIRNFINDSLYFDSIIKENFIYPNNLKFHQKTTH